MILFTSDIDWASEEVIQDTLNLFAEYKVKCTLFVTHDSKVLRECPRNLFEVAIHPNFNPLLGGNNSTSLDQIIDNLLDLYPEAKGVRSHSMTQSTPILGKFAEKGLVYDANHFLPYQKIQVFKLWNGMWRIPYNWEDDIHYLYQKSFNEIGMDINPNDLYVFDFHPIHVFLNTDCEQTYLNAKPFYHETEKLKQLRNISRKGARDMLIHLLQKVQQEQQKSFTLHEYYKQLVGNI